MNKDFEQIFKPMYYLTTMCCVRKNYLTNRKISSINKKDVIISVFANTGILILYYITFNELISHFVTPIIFYTYFVTYLLYVIDHFILHIINFVQSKNNLALFLTLREIYTHLSLRKELKTIKMQLILLCMMAISGYLFFVVWKVSMDPLWTWARGLFIFSSIIFDFELIYSSFIVVFIWNKMKTWAKILRNIDERINNYEDVIRKMDKVFHMLMDAIIFNKKSFQFTVIINNLKLVFWIKNRQSDKM